VSHRGFPEDEFPEAKQAAEHFGIKLNEIEVGEGVSDESLEAIVAAMDEPLAISSLVGLHGLFRAIAPSRRVALTGDGGDELFAGYDWHHGMPAVPAWARTSLFKAATPLLSRLSHASVASIGYVASHVRRHPASVYLDKLRVTTDNELRLLGLDTDFDDPMEESAAAAWDRFERAGELQQMLAVDRATALVDEMLAKVDTSSMAHSVESRVPLLASGVLGVAKALPATRLRDGATGKLCLRLWYGELGPARASVRRKTGFSSPLAAWFEGKAATYLREQAIEGASLVSATTTGAGHRTLFGLAVLGSWVHLRRDRPMKVFA
jgi:asparagine synthase (glutamine-hydrolysing)